MKPLNSADQTAIRILFLLLMLGVTWRMAVLNHRYRDVVMRNTELEKEQNQWMPVVTRVRFQELDRALAQQPVRNRRVVLMGDSITHFWDPPFVMPDSPIDIINRGASGENCADMLRRFSDDVILVRAFAVIVNAGTNDVKAGKPLRYINLHIHAMATMARAKGIKVILATLPPLPGHQTEVEVLNKWIRFYAERNQYGLLDFHTALGGYGDPRAKIHYRDQIHPTKSGYAIMSHMTHDLLRKLL